MCKSLEIMRNESEIQGAIKIAKSINISDEIIVKHLVSTYDCLSEEEAKKLVKEYEDWPFVRENWIIDIKRQHIVPMNIGCNNVVFFCLL